MTEAAEHLKEEILQLPSRDRAELAYCLLRSLDDADVEAAWEVELERRWREIENGEAVGKSAEAVFVDLRKNRP